MTKTATAAHQVRLATDVCIDYSIGQKVFAYLEKTLTDDEEISGFVSHAGDCSFCMQTIIKWHYDCVITEMNDKAAEMNVKSIGMAAFATKQNRDWPTGQNIADCPVSQPSEIKQNGIDEIGKANTRAFVKTKYSN